ncbi:urea transporter [Mailhella massiliensis]|uniref:Urea transporter n=1 Tax=Mailhella massiliensis TaxID=1903261 RepID=A0A921DR99_9BACT|nr:urea transporter [Mailhella massiliensis]HJD96801.1 urea transporter [Mailhella massiliensis]
MVHTSKNSGAAEGARYYPFPRVVDVLLRGAGQVMFQNSPWTGLFFLLGIAWGSWRADRPEIVIGALTGLCVGTLAACLLHAPREEIDSGLHGYNGILVGCALPVFFGSGPMCWALVFAGAFFSTVIMMAVSSFLSSWKVSAMTGPFVFTTWFILLASYNFVHFDIVALPEPSLPAQPSAALAVIPGLEALFRATFTGVSQVFLIDNAVTGAIFLAGIAASSLPAALLGWGGSVLAIAVALVLGADGRSVEAGLYQFSAVLTAIGLGSTFYRPGWRVLLYAFLGTVFTVVAQGALNVALAPLGIPTLTFPFVIAAWLFLLPHVHFAQKGSDVSPSD